MTVRRKLRARILSSAAIVVLSCLCCAVTASSQPAAAALASAGLRLGAAWYPEQWPESHWDADLTLMQQAHFNVVRVGEFAWAALEPSEGHYDFAWLDRAVALAARHHIAVVLATPTDAPPAWLTTKYPQTLRVDPTGHRATHGNRRQFNYANPLYRRFCRDIDVQLARRFGHNPNVIGWQIGNEYTDESFDPATVALFQQFLRAKYRTLNNLNTRWTTAYWSQTYTAWSQIPMESTRGNPGLLLDHKRFVTATWRSFQRNQVDALRPLTSPAQFLTTNIGGLGWSDNWDHYTICADLDLASWDDYVGQGHLDAPRNAMLNDFVRGWRRQNFWVMETEPGSVNWAPVNNTLYPGETRALAWQTVAHGADAVLYWQWRSALNGQEQYHGTIIGPDGEPDPIYPEIAQLGQDFALARTALAGTSPHADIALLFTYPSRWAIDFQPHTRLYDQEQVLLRFYTPLQRGAESSGNAIDIVDPTRGSLAGYKFLVAPSLNVIDVPLAAKLIAWVQAGGHLLLGPRSGMKNGYNGLNTQLQPGPLGSALGARVAQFYALLHPVPLAAPALTVLTPPATADIWAERLTPLAPDVHTDLRYGENGSPFGWLEGQPAMVTRKLGRGSISYLGTLPDGAILQTILNHAATAAGISVSKPPPDGIEICERRTANNSRRVLIVLNHHNAPNSVTLPGRYRELLHQATLTATTSAAAATSIALPPEGVAVLIPEPTISEPTP